MTNNSVLLIPEIKKEFGEFKYIEGPGGRIVLMDNWRNENIILLDINDKRIWCNKKIAPQYGGLFADFLSNDLWDELDIRGGGCYVARHKFWNAAKELSPHAWGIALDLNPDKYPYGSDKKPDNKIIELFNKWGFFWGGNFSNKDPMHFEWYKYIL